MLLRIPSSDGVLWTNILILYIFVFHLSGLQVPASEDPSAMTTKLHQKLIEDIRLHKRLVGLLDEQEKGYKQRRGSYQNPIEIMTGIEPPRHKQSGRMNEAFREDYEDKLYISGDRRNSRLERERFKPKAIETSSSRYELVPYETPTNSKSIKPFERMPMNYSYNDMAEYVRHQQQSKINNSINKKRVPTVSNGIAGTRHRNSDRADDGSHLGGFANPMHDNHNHIAKKSHHRLRRSFDLGEINRQCFSDSDIGQSNSNNAQWRSYLQIAEISRDTQKLEHILNERSVDGCRNLLKGAMDLEESLRILAKFQKATGSLNKAAQRPRQSVDLQELFPHFYETPPKYPFEGRSEQYPRLSLDGREVAKTSSFNLKDAIRASLNRQKMLYSKKSDGLVKKKDNIRSLDPIRGSNSVTLQIDNKKRIPNVIARLMGLEELPSDSRPDHHHTNSKPVANRRPVIRTDSFTQPSRSSERETMSKTLKPRPQQSNSGPISLYASDSRKLSKDSGDGQKSYIFMDGGEDYHDTIKAALRQIKHQVTPKPSFQEELSLKLNRLYGADHQISEQEPKTLKQILETMQMKGILNSGSDQVEPNVGNNNDVVDMEKDVQVLKPVIEMKKGTRKAQDHHHQRPFQTSSLLESETTTTRNPNPSNKVSFKGVATSPSPPSIVIIKPVSVSSSAQQKAENPPKSTELHPKTPKHGNLVKNTDAQKKISLSELNRSVDDGESKKKNTKNSSVSDGLLQRPKQRTTRSGGDGVLQKQIKSQKPRPPPPSELTKKRSERVSKTNNNNKGTMNSSASKTEKQKRVQNHHSKPKVSGSRPRPSLPRASTDRRISSETKDIDTGSQLPVDQNGLSISDVENNVEEEREKPPKNPDQVEGIEPASEDEIPVSNLSSRTDQHKNNSLEDAVTVSTISPVSVLELPAEADPQEVEEEEEEEEEIGAAAAAIDNEIQEEEEQDEESSSLASHIKDSDDKTDIFPSQQLSNYGHETKLTPPFFDNDDIDCKEYVWQMIAKNVTLMDNASMEAEQTELYSLFYHKLEEMEIASFGGLEAAYKRRQPLDVLERRLILDCSKELLQRKKRLRLQMKQPLLSSRRRKVSLGLKRSSIPDLVQELRDDVAELSSYQQLGPSHDDVRNEAIGEDFLYGVLQKDLSMGSAGASSIWNPSWDNGLYGEEQTHDCAIEIENMVFDELLEEIICDIGSVWPIQFY